MFRHDEAKRKAHEQKIQDQEQFLEDLRQTFGTAPGKRVLDWILYLCRVNETIFTGNSQMHHLSGAQDFGNDLREWVELADVEILIDLTRRRAERLKKAYQKGKEDER